MSCRCVDDECCRKDWRCGAVAHASFLHRAAHGSLAAFEYPLWDFSFPDYEPW